MRSLTTYALFTVALLLFLLSFIAIGINHRFYHFSANNYFPPNSAILGIILSIFYWGLSLFYGRKSKQSRQGLELIYFFIVMSLIALATNAVQLTPFTPIDPQIIAGESAFHLHLTEILQWTYAHPTLYFILSYTYDSLPYQMSLLPLLLIIINRFSTLKDYYFMLLTTTLIGFSIYYFFPTIAPASAIGGDLFSPYQLATGVKFNQIHHHIPPTTLEGGLIAFPSFHTIWALLCVYILKEWTIPCLLLFVVNALLIASCVLLGWHYVSDILAGFIITFIAYFLLICTRPHT